MLKKLFKILLIFLLLCVTFFGIYTTIKSEYFNNLINKNKNTAAYLQQNPFSNLSGTNQPGSELLSPEIEESFKTPEDKVVFQYGWDLIRANPDIAWDHTIIPIEARIEDYNSDTKTLTLQFVTPENAPFYNQSKTVLGPTDCNENNTFIKNETGGYTDQGGNFYAELGTGKYVMSFCTDAACTQLHKLCKILYYEQLPTGE
jgi:hypothetical protein